MSEDRGVSRTTKRKAAPPEPPKVRKKIALVGYTVSRAEAPWGDPEWEVLGCNNLHTQIPELWPQATGWFNLHRWADIVIDPVHVEWLKTVTFPVFMFPEAIEEAKQAGHVFPSAQPFPHREIVEKFRGQLFGHRYFTNSIAWMIALSVVRLMETGDTEGAEIALYGIDLAQHTEYVRERPCVEYWLGVAEGAGIAVKIAKTADILRCAGLYGVDEGVSDLAVKLESRLAELNEKAGQLAGVAEGHRSSLEQTRYIQHQIQGALENTQYILQNWMAWVGNVRQGGEDPYSTLAAEPEVVGAPSG